jgi:hypothetical protein
MMFDETGLLRRFHAALVREIHSRDPRRLESPFTVAEIYQELVPYRSQRDQLGVEMNADYEHALLRLLAGEGGFLNMESEAASKEIREELDSPNPNTTLYRSFAAAEVRLNPDKLDPDLLDLPAGAAPPEPESGDPMADWEPTDEILPGAEDQFSGEGSVGEELEGEGEGEDSLETELDEALAPGESVHQVSGPVMASPRGKGGKPERDLPVEDQLPYDNCPWCKEGLPKRPGVRFCPFCGSNVRLVPCPSCGEELELNWRFCVACGTEVQS